MEELQKGKGVRGFWRIFCFAAFGITALVDITNPYNLVNLMLGALTGLLFGWVTRRFLILLIGLFNRDLKKEQGKDIVSLAVGKGLIFMVPFAVLSLLATFVLGWSVPGGFLSVGLMAGGVGSALELDRIKGKSSIQNSLASTVGCGAFSALWALGIGWISIVPAYITGGFHLIKSLLQ